MLLLQILYINNNVFLPSLARQVGQTLRYKWRSVETCRAYVTILTRAEMLVVCQSEQKEQYRYIVRLSPVPGHWHPHGATAGWGGDNGAMRADTRQ